MLLQITLLVLMALLFNYLFTLLKLPGILGMILTGIMLGPEVFNMLDANVLEVLKEFKTAALIVILIRAGLGINKNTLQKVGLPAIKMSLIPCIFEGTLVLLLAHWMFNFTLVEAGILGFIIAAVSPAVVVPQMLALKEGGYGKKREVPTLVLAGASVDDVFAITIFGVFLGLAGGHSVNYFHLFITVPFGIMIGALLGVALGFGLVWFFKKFHIRDTKKVLIFMIVAVGFYELTEWEQLKDIVSIAGLLGVMAIGFVILERYNPLANRLAIKFNKVWVLAEILLFAYIGSEVRIGELDGNMILTGLFVLFLGLVGRSMGVWISLWKSPLNLKEKLFCIIAYWPKATVQAAIGAIPLTMILAGELGKVQVETGETILTIAVLSIVITAPLGAIAIKVFGPKLLSREDD